MFYYWELEEHNWVHPSQSITVWQPLGQKNILWKAVDGCFCFHVAKTISKMSKLAAPVCFQVTKTISKMSKLAVPVVSLGSKNIHILSPSIIACTAVQKSKEKEI